MKLINNLGFGGSFKLVKYQCVFGTQCIEENLFTSGQRCGNGVYNIGEECDNDFLDNTDGCDNQCKTSVNQYCSKI